MKARKLLLWSLPALLLLIQLFRIEKDNPPVVAAQDFRQVMRPPADVVQLIETACYDCHSHETRYPWYADVAPFSWMLRNHIVEGREHLNFSTFGTLPADERAEALHEAAETVEEGEMPMKGYVALHPQAKLTDEQRALLVQWLYASNPIGGADGGEDEYEHEE